MRKNQFTEESDLQLLWLGVKVGLSTLGIALLAISKKLMRLS
jgi:hypothetical protein